MAGKTTTKPKVKKEEPKVDMTLIDDMLLRLSAAENNVDTMRLDVDNALELIDEIGIHELTARVEKVEARLGLR